MSLHSTVVGAVPGLLASLALLGGAGAGQTNALGSEAKPRQPGPLGGVPLRHATGLRLLVADVPPFILDVDSGRMTQVRGVPTPRLQALWVVGVDGKAAVVVADSRRVRRLYSVRRHGARAIFLGAGRNLWPAPDGESVWVGR